MAKTNGTGKHHIGDVIGTIVLSLVLAVIVWVNAIYQIDKPREEWYTELIRIDFVNVPAGLALRNDPQDYVKVRVKAFSSSWEGLTSSSFHAVADWASLGEGTHPVPVKVTCSDRTVSITAAQPETIYVQLERTIKAAVEVTAVLQDLDLVPPGYAVDTPELNPRFVTVEGPFSLVEQVASAVVRLSLADRRQPIVQQMEPQLLDGEGAVVRGVKLSPGQVSVSIGIEQKLNYREVAVRGAITGQPARGYYVSSVEVDPATITVVGPPAVIAEMPGLVSTLGEIDVTGETRLQFKRLPLDLPAGVTPQDGRTDVLVTVGIDPIMSGMNVAVPLEMRRVPDGLKGTLGVPVVEVYLTGPAVLLDELQVGLLEAYVDLNELNAGLHQLKPVVNLLVAQNQKLAEVAITSISPAYVAVELSALPTPTPTATPTPTHTETPSPTGTAPGPRATPTRTPAP
ncbi:MAG: hypothetical protein GX557_01810 [Chloroflexi bacterium]|nr:hypothetical protein [Chloroflexota bacterium]